MAVRQHESSVLRPQSHPSLRQPCTPVYASWTHLEIALTASTSKKTKIRARARTNQPGAQWYDQQTHVDPFRGRGLALASSPSPADSSTGLPLWLRRRARVSTKRSPTFRREQAWRADVAPSRLRAIGMATLRQKTLSRARAIMTLTVPHPALRRTFICREGPRRRPHLHRDQSVAFILLRVGLLRAHITLRR